MSQPTPDPLSRAAELLRSGYQEDARVVLVGFLKENPNSAKAWWLMSFAVSNPDQQISCLKRVLLLSPQHGKAQARLAALTGKSTGTRLTAKKTASEQKPAFLSLPAMALLVVFGCLGFLVVGFFGYRIFFPLPTAQPTKALVVQNPAPGALSSSEPLPTRTITPTIQTTPTPTAPPDETATPLISDTPTPDPNATSTRIPENLIGIGNGQYPPDFTLVDAISGQDFSLSDYADQPKLIVFLTTWCTYCASEMPAVQAIYEKYQDEGLVVIGIGIGASRSALRTYAGRFGITFPLLSDWEHDIAREYAAHSIPANYFIRKSGKIWQVSVGMMKEDELDATIASILKVP